MANLQQCESLTYEIKEQKALINYRKNKINDLINIIENNKAFNNSKAAFIILNFVELISELVKYVIKFIVHPNKEKNSIKIQR